MQGIRKEQGSFAQRRCPLRIVVNGFPREVPKGATVEEVLELLNEPVDHVLVELGGSFIPAKEYSTVRVSPDDRIEVIYPAFGG